MKKISLLSLMVFIGIIGFCQADITVKDTRKFTMSILDDSGKVKGQIDIIISGKFEEKKGSKNFYFDFDSVEAKTPLGYPLNIYTIADSLSKKYKETYQPDVFFSDHSINNVFLWLYLLNQKNEEGPTVGRLNIGQLTKPETKNDNNSERIQMLEQFSNRTKINSRKLIQLSVAMSNEVQQLNAILKNIHIETDSAIKNDFVALQGIQTKLKIGNNIELTKQDTAAITNILRHANSIKDKYDAIPTINRAIHDSLDNCKSLLAKLNETLNLNQRRTDSCLRALQSYPYSNNLQDSIESIRASIFANLQKNHFDSTYEFIKRQLNNTRDSGLRKNLDTAITITKRLSDSIQHLHNTIQSIRNSIQAGLNSFQLDRDTSKFTSIQANNQDSVQKIQSSFPRIAKIVDTLKQRNDLLLNDSSYFKNNLAALPPRDSVAKSIERLQELSDVTKSYDSIYKSLREIENQMRKTDVSKIEKVSIQFERGHLERVQVWVENSTGGVDIYENIYAIGFTSITNFAAFQTIRLFERSRDSKYIYLSDALPRYDNLLDLYTRDYSPADTVINEYLPDSGPITLKKERNINLFESKIYTDLEGLNQDKPNGLIQIEIAKRFNLLTYRKQVPNHRADFSSLSYLTVFGALTKIEDKQKEFVLKNNNTIVNDVIVSPSYISNLDLRRYENLNVGFELNTFLFDYPTGKFTTYIDFGFRYGHTNLVDSIYTVEDGKPVSANKAKQIDGNAVTITFPKITFELFSQRRVGFCASYSYNKTYAFTNNQYKQVMSYEKSDLNSTVLEKKARGSHVGELFARIETNREGNGQLFFRTRLFWQQGDANTFFSQIQVGYNYNIIFKK